MVSTLRPYSYVLPHIGVAVAILIYAIIQIQHFTPAFQETDPDGYLFLAKRMASLEPLTTEDDPFIYQSHVWIEDPDGKVLPKFSPGYPFLMAIFYRIGGDDAMYMVSPVMGGLALLGAYLLFRLWMSSLAAALGVWALATNPMYCIYSGYLLTHAANTCAIVWGMYFLWKWTREHPGKHTGILAGLLLGFALTVRPTSTLLAMVVLVAVVSRWWQNRGTTNIRWQMGILIGCYAVFPLILVIYNWSILGNPFTTGYGLSREQNAFTLEFFRRNLHLMVGGLNTTALYLVFPIGLAGMLLVGPLRERLMRLLWFLPIAILYTSYYWALGGMAYLRFTICLFPVVVGSAFLLLDRALDAEAGAKLWVHRGAMILFLVLIVFLRYGETQRGMSGTVSDPGSRAVANGGRMLSETLQPDAVIFSQSPFFCAITGRKRFRHYDLPRLVSLFNSPERRQPKRTERLQKFFDSLDDADKLRKKRELVRGYLDQLRQVVFFIPQSVLEREQQQLGDNFRFSLLKEWEVEIASPPPKWGVYQVESGQINQ